MSLVLISPVAHLPRSMTEWRFFRSDPPAFTHFHSTVGGPRAGILTGTSSLVCPHGHPERRKNCALNTSSDRRRAPGPRQPELHSAGVIIRPRRNTTRVLKDVPVFFELHGTR